MRRSVLIVDDDANMRESIADNLEVEGYEVKGAASGGQALAALGAHFYDVILMDYNLQGETGFEVIAKIRAVNQDSQILMLTGNATLDTAIKALREQVTDFLTKPVDFDLLKHRIAKAVERLDMLQKLRHLNEMKSKFMSMSSHDLSNSLMTLQVSFEMLTTTIPNPSDDQKKRMNYIANGISQISRLIEDLVDWAAIEQGRFRLEPKPFDPGRMVEEALSGPQARAATRGIGVSAQVEPGLPQVSADKRRIAQVLNNLLENAVRHTLKGGQVQVLVARDGPGVRFSVRDTGEGIESQELDKIFRSFYQGSGQAGGGRLGLGLSISREIVSAHKGRLWVESPGKGRGATFHFTVPASP